MICVRQCRGINKLINHRLFKQNDLHFENLKRCNDLTCIYLTLATAERISFLNKAFVHYRCNTGKQTSTDRFGKKEYFIYAAAALEQRLQDLGLYEKFYNKIFYTLAISLRWETKNNINLLKELAKEKISPRLFHDLYETRHFEEMKLADVETYVHKMKLFFFLSFFSWKEQGEFKVWYICGIPVMKRLTFYDGMTTKYYLFGLPFIKISHKIR